MPNYYSRLNLASAIFPFYTEAAGRTIMVPQLDENWDRYNAANTTQDKGVPQVFYMHNVLPIAGGFQSIGYIQQLAGIINHNDFDQAFILRNSDLTRFIFVPANGANYIYDSNVGTWASVSPIAGVTPTTLVTVAYVQGQSYIYYSGIGCYMYNSSSRTLTPITLTSLNAATTMGICAANGYMIAWSANTIAWSSLTNPTNFTPSIQTGAGGGSPGDIRGAIHFCLPISNGFLIYCDNNTVGASFTGNTAYPYIFAEVPNSGGCSDPDKVGWQSNLDTHLALTTSGLQSINKSNAVSSMPELSDFLSAQLFEDFNETTQQFSTSFLGNQLYTKISAIGDRYLVISYGQSMPDFTHAIVFDIVLNRYGKLKINHRSCFNYSTPTPFGNVTYGQLLATPISSFGTTITYGALNSVFETPDFPKKTLAFLQKDGTIQLVDFEISEANAVGVFIIGKFQMQRSATMIHQRTDVETVNAASTFSLSLLPTFDGKDFAVAVPTVLNKANTLTRTYAKRYTASNISLLIQGAFNLTSIIINFMVGGSR